jgi:hypothetical protein
MVALREGPNEDVQLQRRLMNQPNNSWMCMLKPQIVRDQRLWGFGERGCGVGTVGLDEVKNSVGIYQWPLSHAEKKTPEGRIPRYIYMETPDGEYFCGFDMR